jgi:hypothetical protein
MLEWIMQYKWEFANTKEASVTKSKLSILQVPIEGCTFKCKNFEVTFLLV